MGDNFAIFKKKILNIDAFRIFPYFGKYLNASFFCKNNDKGLLYDYICIISKPSTAPLPTYL